MGLRIISFGASKHTDAHNSWKESKDDLRNGSKVDIHRLQNTVFFSDGVLACYRTYWTSRFEEEIKLAVFVQGRTFLLQ